MLTVAEETLNQAAQGKDLSIYLYGQEVNPETYAICKADLILKGEGRNADNIRYGTTLAADGFPGREFDFMLSNPPYGKSWKSDLDRNGRQEQPQGPPASSLTTTATPSSRSSPAPATARWSSSPTCSAR